MCVDSVCVSCVFLESECVFSNRYFNNVYLNVLFVYYPREQKLINEQMNFIIFR